MNSDRQTLAAEIAHLTGQDPMDCYQCGKCAAGCPVRDYADSPPNRVVRFVQLGFDTRALEARAAWLCAGCMTCTSRCPQEFDLAAFMDAVRELGRRRGVRPDPDIARFHESFLAQIRRHGRAYELGLVRDYKLGTGHLMQDVDLAPAMFAKGKLALFPHNVRGRAVIARMFLRAEEASAAHAAEAGDHHHDH
jgi:heterodisulfide reductase subunit C2